MSGPKSSYYDITAIQRRILQEQRREEERRRREAEKRRHEEEQRRREIERKRREEEARQARIKKSDDVIDKAFEIFSTLEPKKISDKPAKFDATKFLNQLDELAKDSRLSAELLNKIEKTKSTFEKISDPTYRKNFTALNITPIKKCAEYLKIYDEISALAIDCEPPTTESAGF